MPIQYSNIFYFKKISQIGGTEQFLYEIAKKYKNYDITFFFDEADEEQLQRLRKIVRCRKRIEGQKVVCERAFFNFNIDMIDDVESTENYYCFVSHANYQELNSVYGEYIPPISHPKINHFIGVSQFATDMLDEYAKKIGKHIKTEKCYNPMELEPVKKPKIIVSACRLDDKVKGGERTIQFIDALDRFCEKNKDENYMFFIFTNPTELEIESPNVYIKQPTINIRPFIAMADYIAQFSNDMETFCYTINEALGYGVPIVTTPLSILKELPITDNEHIVLDWDCSNVDEVVEQIFQKKVKKFKYNILQDNWKEHLVLKKSSYQKDLKRKFEVECIKTYYDLELKRDVYGRQWGVPGQKEIPGEILTVDYERKEHLVNLGLVSVRREI